MNASTEGNNNNDDDNNNNNNNNNNNDQRKKGKGRQKTKMAKIENENNLQVTFSKRRAGIFKKASELSTLCGAESAVLIFSPGDKPHTFGHPDFDTISNRFLDANKTNIANENPQPTTIADQLIAAHSKAAMQQSAQKLVSTEANLDQEKRQKRELDNSNKVDPQSLQIEELNHSQLGQMKEVITSFEMVYGDASKMEAENVIFNANNDGGGSSWNNVNHNVATNSSWNNININHDVDASSLWNNVNHNVVGSSSWRNVNDLPANSPWESHANVVPAADNSSWEFANAAAGNPSNWENFGNANSQPHGLGFQNSFFDYGGPSMIPAIPNVPPYPYPAVDGGSNLNNFGLTYAPPMGPIVTDFNFGVNPTPTSVVPYDIGQGSSQPTANPNPLPPQDPHDPNGAQFRRS